MRKYKKFLLILLIIPLVIIFLVYRSNENYAANINEIEKEGYMVFNDTNDFSAYKTGGDRGFVIYQGISTNEEHKTIQYYNTRVVYTFELINNNLEVQSMQEVSYVNGEANLSTGESLCPSVQSCKEDYFFQILYYKLICRIELIDISTKIF